MLLNIDNKLLWLFHFMVVSIFCNSSSTRFENYNPKMKCITFVTSTELTMFYQK